MLGGLRSEMHSVGTYLGPVRTADVGHYHIGDSSEVGSEGIFYRRRESQLTAMVKASVL